MKISLNKLRDYIHKFKINHSPHQLWVNTILLKSYLTHQGNTRPQRNIEGVDLFYRISDAGYKKVKPDYITKENCLANAVAEFPLDQVTWHVLADNVCEETYQMILKYIPDEQIERVTIKNGAGTFQKVFEEAVKLADDRLVYFLEDDYMHAPGTLQFLKEAAQKNYTDYFTLYDHPDKYDMDEDCISPFSNHGGEDTKVFWCGTRHWKLTNSTTMTFAAFADIIKRDKGTFWRWTSGQHPFDFELFNDLRISKGALLSNPIPSLSTHGEILFTAPGVKWEENVTQKRQ